jgi:hypothetical protein
MCEKWRGHILKNDNGKRSRNRKFTLSHSFDFVITKANVNDRDPLKNKRFYDNYSAKYSLTEGGRMSNEP